MSAVPEVLIGLAAGDALGGPFEFLTPEEVRARYGDVTGPVERNLGPSPFAPGELTDDTQMALCLLAAYPADDGLVARARAAFRDWLAGRPRDVGALTRAALETDPFAAWKASGFRSCGNGALMRAAASVAAGRRGDDLLADAVLLGAVTHADPRSLLACAVYCAGLRALVDGASYRAAWEEAVESATRLDLEAAVAGPFGAEDAGAVASRRGDALREVWRAVRDAQLGRGAGNGGYAVSTLQTAIAQGAAPSFAEGILPVVRAGDDADTVAAVTGAILAARGLPPPPGWLRDLRCRERFAAWPWGDSIRGEEVLRRLRQACLRAAG